MLFLFREVMNLRDKIKSAENQYMVSLEDFFTVNYPADYVFSHGLGHHRRVWGYAKEILYSVGHEYETDNLLFIQKLLICCFLHDIGMVVDPGPRHGRHSRLLCRKFLLENNINHADFKDVLDVLENHDNKNYKEAPDKNMLFMLLSISDDLDAFGYTGIYRYVEIYLKREVAFNSIGKMILENAAQRFQNFTAFFRNSPELIEKYERSYQVLVRFFKNYNIQSIDYQFNTNKPKGYCGVVEIISDYLNTSIPSQPLTERYKSSEDPIIQNFLESLAEEENQNDLRRNMLH